MLSRRFNLYVDLLTGTPITERNTPSLTMVLPCQRATLFRLWPSPSLLECKYTAGATKSQTQRPQSETARSTLRATLACTSTTQSGHGGDDLGS